MITVHVIFDHRNRTERGKPGPVEFRITHNRKSHYISTGIRVKASEFRGETIINRGDADALNERVNLLRKIINNAINDSIRKYEIIEFGYIKNCINKGKSSVSSETPFLDWYEENYKKLPVSEQRKKHYRSTLAKLTQYGKLAKLSDLTKAGIIEFDVWLHEFSMKTRTGDISRRLDDSTIYNQHKNVKRMLRLAVDTDMIDENPYDKMRGVFSKGEKENIEYLRDEDIKKIVDFSPSSDSRLSLARDIFVCQIYTGMAFADMMKTKLSDYDKRDGKYIKVGRRTKTGSVFVTQLLPPIVRILEKYGGSLPHITNQEYNRLLKSIGVILDLKPKLHSHLARHTFATIMLKNGVSIENLQSMMGHRKITQTLKYAKVLAESVTREFSRIEDLLFNK